LDFDESEGEEGYNEDEADKFFDEMRSKVKDSDAKDKEVIRKKKLLEKKEKDGQ